MRHPAEQLPEVVAACPVAGEFQAQVPVQFQEQLLVQLPMLPDEVVWQAGAAWVANAAV